jgi:serine/threonine-protein kinase
LLRGKSLKENIAPDSQSVTQPPNNSITNLTDTDKTIDELRSEGYQGVNYELTENDAFIATANHFAEKIQWVKTSPDADGDVGLMTLDVQAFDELLDFMLDNFGWCPRVYSNKSAPEIHIFPPENELEEMAIQLATDGEYRFFTDRMAFNSSLASYLSFAK